MILGENNVILEFILLEDSERHGIEIYRDYRVRPTLDNLAIWNIVSQNIGASRDNPVMGIIIGEEDGSILDSQTLIELFKMN